MTDQLPAVSPSAATPNGGKTNNPPVPWLSIGTLLGSVVLSLGLLLIPADTVERLGAFGYIGVFVLVLLSSATVVLPSPAVGVALIAGRSLNPWLVGLLSGVAAGIGEITGYLVGSGGNQIAMRSRYYQRVERWVSRWGLLTIFVLAAIPAPILDLAGIAAGAMGMPFRRFLLACIAVKTLRFIGVAWIGALYF